MDAIREQKIFSVWSFKALSHRQIAGRVAFFLLVLAGLAVGAFYTWAAVKWVDKPFGGFTLNRRMVVGGIGKFDWTGVEAGLKFPDKVLKANGTAVTSVEELEEIISTVEVGTPVRYSVDRGGKLLEVDVPTMRFTWKDLFMTFGMEFSQGLLYLIIGLSVFILKPDMKISWIALSACFLQSISSFGVFNGETTHIGPVRPYIIIETFMPALVLHLSMLFPEKSRIVDREPRIQVLPYLFSTAIFIPFVTLYPNRAFLPFYKITLVYMNISTITLIVSALVAFVRKSSPLARQRARVVLIGAIVAFPVPTMGILVGAMGWTLGGLKIMTNYTSLPMVIFPMAISYAIARHNLFDVDVYMKRALVYGSMTAFVLIVDIVVHLIIEPLILHPIFGENAKKIYPILIALMVVLFFHPVLHRVQKIVDKLFFRKKFDYKGAIRAVGNALASVLRLDDIVKRIIYTVKNDMFIDSAGVILLEPVSAECKSLFVTDTVNPRKDELREDCVLHDDPLVSLVSREKKLVTVYDVMEDPRYAAVCNSCRQRFDELGATIAMPLIYQNEVKAILAVGNKKSGHFYTREDIEFLETLTHAGAVAIENAKFAEKMEHDERVRTSLSRYVSPQIVNKIVNNDIHVNLGGDKKVVTILSCEIRKFASLIENRPPEQLVRIMNRYFTEMSRIIFKHEGTVDKFIKDTIMAVFGGIISIDNAPEAAVKAAIQMMNAMPRLNRRLSQEYGVDLEIGIGISTGEVFLGNVGSPERMEFTVIGEAVNLAGQISGMANAGQIIVTPATAENLGEEIAFVQVSDASRGGDAGELHSFEILYR